VKEGAVISRTAERLPAMKVCPALAALTLFTGFGPFTAIETISAAHDQNSNFIASWTSLGEPLDEITPAV
jgi:hypothetical protein